MYLTYFVTTQRNTNLNKCDLWEINDGWPFIYEEFRVAQYHNIRELFVGKTAATKRHDQVVQSQHRGLFVGEHDHNDMVLKVELGGFEASLEKENKRTVDSANLN